MTGRPAARDAWVLFDLDGTLLDYTAAEAAALAATLAHAGLAVDDAMRQAYRTINARHWGALERGETTPERLRVERWRDLLDDHGLTAPAPDEVAERYLDHLAAGVHLIDGALEVLAEVSATHRIGVITNGLADVSRPRVHASGIGAFAEVFIVSDEVGVAKPHPGIFDAAFAAMGHPERSAVTMVGDSLTADIAGARAYGLRTVWYAAPDVPEPESDALQPDHRIADLRHLADILG